MFKYVVFFAVLAVVFADPEPKAKPGLVAAAYTAPVVAAAPVAYTAPIAYTAKYVTPGVAAPLAYTAAAAGYYPAAYSAYSAYSAPLILA